MVAATKDCRTPPFGNRPHGYGRQAGAAAGRAAAGAIEPLGSFFNFGGADLGGASRDIFFSHACTQSWVVKSVKPGLRTWRSLRINLFGWFFVAR